MERIQVLVTAEEREAFRRLAEREGESLSGWLRKAGLDRLATTASPPWFRSTEDLLEFFRRCDEVESGREPDWDQHLEVMRRSREGGQSGT